MPVHHVSLPDPAATQALGAQLAAVLHIGDTLALDGPLGAGKTSLVRGLVQARGGDPAAVASPTFTLLHHYQANPPIVHVDAYRLHGLSDLCGLGFFELLDDSIACVEWAARIADLVHEVPVLWSVSLHHQQPGRLADIQIPADRDWTPA
jgi:tRNA threonylcarbamoyl adenosine modification protein YjeE